MNLDQFVQKYNGVGVDTDGAYGYQLNIPVFNFSLFSGFYSIFKIAISAQENMFITNSNFGMPFLSRFIPSNSINTRRAINSNATVSKVGRVSADTKITSSIIKSISVYMINIVSGLGINQKSMQLPNLIIRKPFLNIERISHLAHTPLSTNVLQKLKIGSIKKNIKRTMFFTLNWIDSHVYIITGGNHYVIS